MAMLVGDPERDRAAHELQRHYREGRLSADELAQRLETALRARDAGQLRSALKELPGVERWAFRSPARSARNAAILAGTPGRRALWGIRIRGAVRGRPAGDGPGLGRLVGL